jgi:hypothetical protein
MDQELDRRRAWSYVFVAVAGLLAGLALGQLATVREPGPSRAAWPIPAPTPAHPLSLEP